MNKHMTNIVSTGSLLAASLLGLIFFTPSPAAAKNLGTGEFVSMAELDNGNVLVIYDKTDIVYRIWDQDDGWQDQQTIVDNADININTTSDSPEILNDGTRVWMISTKAGEELLFYASDSGTGTTDLPTEDFASWAFIYSAGDRLVVLSYDSCTEEESSTEGCDEGMVNFVHLRTWSPSEGLSGPVTVPDMDPLGLSFIEGTFGRSETDEAYAVSENGYFALFLIVNAAGGDNDILYSNVWDVNNNLTPDSADWTEVNLNPHNQYGSFAFPTTSPTGDETPEILPNFDQQGDLLIPIELKEDEFETADVGLYVWSNVDGWSELTTVVGMDVAALFNTDPAQVLLVGNLHQNGYQIKNYKVYEWSSNPGWTLVFDKQFEINGMPVIPETVAQEGAAYFGRFVYNKDKFHLYKWTAENGWSKKTKVDVVGGHAIDMDINVSSKGKVFLTWLKNGGTDYFGRAYLPKADSWGAEQFLNNTDGAVADADIAGGSRYVTPRGQFVTVWKETDEISETQESLFSARWTPDDEWKGTKKITGNALISDLIHFNNMIGLAGTDQDDNGILYKVKQSSIGDDQFTSQLKSFKSSMTTGDHIWLAWKENNGSLNVKKF